MIKIRQVGVYSITMDSNDNYSISNSLEIKKGFKEYHISPLLLYTDEEFIEFCKSLF